MNLIGKIRAAARFPETRKMWIAALASPFLIALSDYLAVAPIGSQIAIILYVPVVFAIPLALFAIVAMPILVCFKRYRGGALAYFFLSAAFLPLSSLGLVAGHWIRMKAFEELAQRSEPLIHAIQSYTHVTGIPPAELTDLIPEYLDEIPKTGMMAYPDYRYDTGESAEAMEGNPWVLQVFAPYIGINFDLFLYFPLQNYPRSGYGGNLERVRDWAYVHE